MSNLDELARSNDTAINAKASCTSNISISNNSSSLIATHTATNTTANNLKYICEICGYLIDNNASLKAHLKSHQQSHNKSTDVNNNEIENDDSEKYKLICYEGSDNSVAPYRFLDESNLFVCSLCNCTYESLRSIKAHLWKHSGHHHLSYPINEVKNEVVISPHCLELEPSNYVEITTTCEIPSAEIPKEVPEEKEKADKEEIEDKVSEKAVDDTNSEEEKSFATPAATSSTRAGICSVLLQVIEQLRCEESNNRSDFEDTSKNKIEKKKAKRKSRVPKSTSDEDDNKIKKKRGRKRKIDAILAESDRQKLEEAEKQNALRAKAAEKKSYTHESSITVTPTSIVSSPKTDLVQISNKCKEIVSIKNEFIDAPDERISIIQSQTMIKEPKMCSTLFIDSNNYSTNSEKKILSLLMSLSTNDGQEQYVCGLCPYVCYHLPSLKSHMWTHVTNAKFDYSLNTTIINAAIDYENKLNRHLQQMKTSESGSKISANLNVDFNQLITYPLEAKISASIYDSKAPIVTFRCSKCGYSTIDLSILRLHKRQHYVRIISSSNVQSKFQLISSESNQKESCCSIVASI